MIVNLTPHPINVYPRDTPDQIEPGSVEPEQVFEPSGEVARIGQIDLGTQYERGCSVPVEYVEFRHANGMPPRPANADYIDTWYVVSLAFALANQHPALLVPYLEVRDMAGRVIGCRMLARPV